MIDSGWLDNALFREAENYLEAGSEDWERASEASRKLSALLAIQSGVPAHLTSLPEAENWSDEDVVRAKSAVVAEIAGWNSEASRKVRAAWRDYIKDRAVDLLEVAEEVAF